MIGVIETTGDRCSVAILTTQAGVGDRPGVLAHIGTGRRNVHDRLLAAMFSDCLDIASVDIAELEAVAVAIGPGSFTGIRIGISFAIGLGLAAERPLVPVSTLDAIAWRGRDLAGFSGRSRLLALVPDRRGDAYAALYNLAPRFQRLTAPYNVPIGDVPEMIDENVLVAGPGGELLDRMQSPVPSSILPLDATTIGLYGHELMRRGLCVEPHQIKPLYIGAAAVTTASGPQQTGR